MKRLIVILLLLTATAYPAVNTQTHFPWGVFDDSLRTAKFAIGSDSLLTSLYGFSSKADIGDTITAHWTAFTATDIDSTLQYIFGYIRVDTLIVDQIGTTVDIVFDNDGVPYLKVLTADSAVTSRHQVKELVGDSLANIDSTNITDGSIGLDDIGTGRITTTHILDGTVAKADLAANSVDSTKIVDGSIGLDDIGTGRITSTHVLDGTIAKVDLADNLLRKIVPLVNVHQPRYVRAMNDTLTLENALGDSSVFLWMVIGGEADTKGSHRMTLTLPAGITDIDSVFFGIQTSDTSQVVSSIDSVQAWVSTSGINQTWQASFTTNMRSTGAGNGQRAYWWTLHDHDFNEGERVQLKFYTRADAAKWVGLTNCYLVCR